VRGTLSDVGELTDGWNRRAEASPSRHGCQRASYRALPGESSPPECALE